MPHMGHLPLRMSRLRSLTVSVLLQPPTERTSGSATAVYSVSSSTLTAAATEGSHCSETAESARGRGGSSSGGVDGRGGGGGVRDRRSGRTSARRGCPMPGERLNWTAPCGAGRKLRASSPASSDDCEDSSSRECELVSLMAERVPCLRSRPRAADFTSERSASNPGRSWFLASRGSSSATYRGGRSRAMPPDLTSERTASNAGRFFARNSRYAMVWSSLLCADLTSESTASNLGTSTAPPFDGRSSSSPLNWETLFSVLARLGTLDLERFKTGGVRKVRSSVSCQTSGRANCESVSLMADAFVK
mmetsp:Transcript_44647/g.95017  ORF Transcript_44647/g.95017 Transcript_44647/m.95017 type:complete len:305 (+) Transcript_44647:984-1898(+)